MEKGIAMQTTNANDDFRVTGNCGLRYWTRTSPKSTAAQTEPWVLSDEIYVFVAARKK